MSETATVANASYAVKLIGVLASSAGKRQIEIDSPQTISLADLISTLILKVGSVQFENLLIDSATRNPLPNVIILLNDQDCNLFQGLNTKLEAGTLITIIPVAHGG